MAKLQWIRWMEASSLFRCGRDCFEDGQDDQRYLQRPKLYRKCQHKNSLYRDISSKGIEDGLLVLYYRSSWLCSLLPVFNCRARGCTFCHFCGLDCCFLGLAKSGSESKNAHNTPILEVWHPYRSTYMGFSCKSAHIWSFASLLLDQKYAQSDNYTNPK